MTALVGAIDVGATKTLVTVRPLPLGTWATDGPTVRLPTPASSTMLASALRALATEAGGAIVAIGVGAPGPIDVARGSIVRSPNQGWRDVPLGPLLAERTGSPVDLDDDANTGALGEATLGAGRGADPVAYITVSTGIGAGIVVGGHVVRGAHGAAGEVGHMVVDPGGPRCSCGRRGCVEAFASGGGLERRARETWPGGIGRDGSPSPRSAADVFRAARSGDPDARRLVADGEAALARAIAALIGALDPERVVVGGSLGLAHRGFVSRAARMARRLTLVESGSDATVVLAALRAASVLAGAAVLAALRAASVGDREGRA